MSLAGIGWAAAATASPPTEGAEQPSCVYTLSTPRLVDVSGTTMVTATLTPYPCTGSINPNSLTVCITPEGTPTAGTCGFSAVPSRAQVFVAYKPGTSYVVRGTGCGSVYTTQGSLCSTVGPFTTTL
ncbi:hypothetical protein CRI77_10905 [Mycolicibacterium duvalii]|uniref:Uncharacterized protein n=1 Tax=Mycolicibacterium duvalii TaxID=39688 RepID=A0A7I7JZK6_9MYCO|nr:hypothetical protein [Mycolicibacterium duvalii]MCV7370947.1 hypothetical protein [Mycolicibacterium duvalii]PEG41251.1 hypothetical protein CRI77_10905 [Mycolicibacterium duvalii]BBX17203.1 hypothetical protein MDUV_20630 [Mycolicibacterium duvalii]